MLCKYNIIMHMVECLTSPHYQSVPSFHDKITRLTRGGGPKLDGSLLEL